VCPAFVTDTALPPFTTTPTPGPGDAVSGRLDQPHTFHYLPDIARGLLFLAGRPEADGQIWHLPAAEPLTAQQFFDLAAEIAGRRPRRCLP
jgi:nucleoside-diphosphate-sugar epimerase